MSRGTLGEKVMTQKEISLYGKNLTAELTPELYTGEEIKIITAYQFGNSNSESIMYEIAYLYHERLDSIISIEIRTDSKIAKLWNYRNLGSYIDTHLMKRVMNAIESLSQRSLQRRAD